MSAEIGGGLLTLEEAAALLRVSPNTVYKMCREGKIPAAKVGRQWRILETELANWLREEPESVHTLRPGGDADPMPISSRIARR
jgi:excisionase family DNA binding protein